MRLIVLICSALTLLASCVTAEQSNAPQDYSDAEIAIIELPPPVDPKQSIESQIEAIKLKSQETRSSSQFSNKKSISNDEPFTITFPLSKGNKRQSVQSIVIPLPTDLNDKTGIIVIEDHSDDDDLDHRTLRAQFFSPNRINSKTLQSLKLSDNRNETEVTINRIISTNKLPQSSQSNNWRSTTRKLKESTTTKKVFTSPSTISTVIFDDEEPLTSTFAPETVFRPKPTNSQTNKKSRKRIENSLPLTFHTNRPINKKTTTLPPNTKLLELRETERTTVTVPETTTTTTTNPPTTFATTRRRAELRQTNSANNRRSFQTQTTPLRTTSLRTTTLRPTTTTTARSFVELDYDTTATETPLENENENSSKSEIEKEDVSEEVVNITKPRPPGAPKIPGNFGFLPSGKAFNIPQNVPGTAGLDYPTYHKIPITNFDCREHEYPGFYSDLEAGCQVYHSCNGRHRGSKHTFLCPNGTIFSQEYLICDWWYNVRCEEAPKFYPLNKEAFSAEPKKIKPNITKADNKRKQRRNKQTTVFVERTTTTTETP